MSFTFLELSLVALIFIWIGFIRTGLGFGGAVLGLPILMLIGGSPIDWLPIIGIHLLFFSTITLLNSLKKIAAAVATFKLSVVCKAPNLGILILLVIKGSISFEIP